MHVLESFFVWQTCLQNKEIDFLELFYLKLAISRIEKSWNEHIFINICRNPPKKKKSGCGGWPQPRTISRRENTYRELNFELDGKSLDNLHLDTDRINIRQFHEMIATWTDLLLFDFLDSTSSFKVLEIYQFSFQGSQFIPKNVNLRKQFAFLQFEPQEMEPQMKDSNEIKWMLFILGSISCGFNCGPFTYMIPPSFCLNFGFSLS